LLFLKGQNRFLPAGRGRCCHCLSATVFFLKVRTGFSCRARPQLPLPHRQGCYFKRSEPVLPAGRGRCCHCLTAKVVFLRDQNRFLPAGRGRSCHRLTAKGRPEEVRTGLYLPGAAALPPPHRQGCFLISQNRFLPAGCGRCCHRLSTKGRPEEVTSLHQQHVNADNVSRHF
jgi:hypothetical protein